MALRIFLLAALPRVLALFYFAPAEPNYYWTLSESLLKHHTLGFEDGATTYIEPLYPAFLAAARLISRDVHWLVMLIQVAVASAGAVFLFQLTLSVSGRVGAAAAAAVFYAFDPYFVRQSVSHIELPFLVTLLLWTLKELQARHGARSMPALAGVLLGALFLTRASLLPVCLAAVIFMALRRGWRQALLAGATATLVVLPWLARNHRVDGSILPSRVGENLFVSTSPYAIGVLPQHDVDLLVPFAQELVERELAGVPAAQLEASADRLLFSRAVDFARSHPRETLALKLRNILYLFWPGLLPVEAKSGEVHAVFDGSRVHIVGAERRPRAWDALHFSARTLLMLAAAVGFVMGRRGLNRHDAPLSVVILAIAAVHVIFFPTTRLLAPMTAVLMVYAGCGIDGLRRSTASTPNPRLPTLKGASSIHPGVVTNSTARAPIQR